MARTWLTPGNVKWLLTALAIPVAIGYVSNHYEKAAAARQETDSRLHLYTELLSKREEADTGVRKGVFDKVIETYLSPRGADVEQKLVALELLALNFNDSLNLSPLFWQLSREIVRGSGSKAQKAELIAHLDRIARDVKDRQLEILEVVGARHDATIIFDEIGDRPLLFEEEMVFRDPDPFARNRQLKRRFKLDVAEHDPVGRRVLLRAHDGKTQWVFWVDVFDFPFLDFTRLSKAERFSAVLRTYSPDSAQVTFVYFPSSRSGVKDKPYMDELLSDLLREAR